MSIAIRHGRLIDPANDRDAYLDLFIDQQRIVGVGRAPEGFTAELTLDAGNALVMPGIIDLAAHLREPGQEHKATIASETRAAAAAGVTTLCCPPDTEPPIDSPAEVELIKRRASAGAGPRVVSLGALTAGLEGRQLSDMAALKLAGCVGISNARQPLQDTATMRRALEYADSHGLTVFLLPADHALSNEGCVHEGAIATRLGLPPIPAAAETAAIGQSLALIEQTGVRAHFCRLSTGRGLRMIAEARAAGLPVSADVSAHQLYLTDAAVADFNSLCHVLPPLRTPADQAALREGLANGVVAAVCSDHQPHEPDAKLAPFSETEPGIAGLETFPALALKLVDEGILSLPQAVARLTVDPAHILGLRSGNLAVGRPADVTVMDLDKPWTVTPDTLLGHAHNTPFMGWTFQTQARYTLVNGRCVYPFSQTGT